MTDPTPLSHRSEPEQGRIFNPDPTIMAAKESFQASICLGCAAKDAALEAEREAREGLQSILDAEREDQYAMKSRAEGAELKAIALSEHVHAALCRAEKAEASLALHTSTLDAVTGLSRQKIAELEEKLDGITLTAREGPMARIKELEAELARHGRCLEAKDKRLLRISDCAKNCEHDEHCYCADGNSDDAKEALALNPEDMK